jgi:glycosyltransferase involved in cell wall biosynthesis
VHGGSGVDVYTRRLAAALTAAGVDVVVQTFAHAFQFQPTLLGRVPQPRGTDIILANSWNAVAFVRPGVPLISVCHLCVHDPALAPYKGIGQRAFHAYRLRGLEAAGYRAAAAVVAVSEATATQVEMLFPGTRVDAIHNGIDIDVFSPGPAPGPRATDGVELLFVGNPSRRKGADLLPAIMRRLGPGHRLRYTSGLRHRQPLPAAANLYPLGCLDEIAVRDAYRRADLLLFPTRLEGFGYAVVEAMACGTLVVGSRAAPLPELIEHGCTGLLCPVDDVDAFVETIAGLAADRTRRQRLGDAARQAACARFSIGDMAQRYLDLFERVLAGR